MMRAGFAAALSVCLALAFALPAAGQSLADLRAAAEAGQIPAQVALGDRYRLGDGVLQSHSRAADWYGRAAEEGVPLAMFHLGRQLASGLGVEPDPVAALDYLRRAAVSGNPEHLFALGNAYQVGLAGTPDLAQAAVAYTAAVEAGSDDAAVSLGLMYYEGQGVPRDVTRAVELYLGPAENGDAQAQNNLGLIYARGDLGAVDYDQALIWFQGAAEAGLPAGLRNLAAMYENGFGVDVDEPRSEALLRAAAAGGSQALTLFEDARFAPADPEALERYAQAADLGDPVASYNFAVVLLSLPELGGADLRRAARAFEAAARRGIPAAMANYGLFLFTGQGTLQDFVEGYAWLTVAVSMGQSDALEVRDRLSGSMTIGQINAAAARSEEIWQEITGRDP